MFEKLLLRLRAVLAGSALTEAIERHNHAAKILDATVREVTKQ